LHASLDDPQWTARRWDGAQAYADSKLLDVVLAFAVARRWPRVLSNAIEPSWVPTKMGGLGAPDDLSLAPVTQTWLVVSDDPAARVTGQNFYHQSPWHVSSAVLRTDLQDELLTYCAGLTGTLSQVHSDYQFATDSHLREGIRILGPPHQGEDKRRAKSDLQQDNRRRSILQAE
jgi:hypothetical protein